MALIYYHEGKYYEAEPLYRGAIEINKKALGEWHPDYAQGLSNMATLYQTLGNYSKAEEFYKQALNIYDKVLDKNHPKYSDCLNNLAKLYLDMGEYFSAAKLFKQLQDIYKKNHREEFPEYAICLNNLATLYENLDHYADAVTLYKQALEVTRKTLGENHNEYAKQVYELLKENNIRAELDDEESNLGGKVRDAKNNKIPYWIVIGDKEIESNKITLESRDNGQLGQISKEELIEKLTKETKEKIV